MITRLKISNFRSLAEDVSIPVGNLTALVGANGAGKSNIVDALRFVSDALKMGLSGAITHRHGIGAVRRWSAGHPFNLRIELSLELPSGSASYAFELRGDKTDEYQVKQETAELWNSGARIGFRVEQGKWAEGPNDLRPPLTPQVLALQLVGGDERFQLLASELQNLAVYSIFPDVLKTPQKYDPTKPMDRYGANWTSVLKDQPQSSWKPELVEILNRLTGDIQDIRIKPAAGYLVTEFRHASSTKMQKWFGAAQESDGTLRVAGIVTALLQEPPLPLIGVEEPELTVHPGAIPLLFDYLKQASRRSQVVVTTHSPELLDLLDADDVRAVVRRTGATLVGLMEDGQRLAVRGGLLTLGDIQRSTMIEPQMSLELTAT